MNSTRVKYCYSNQPNISMYSVEATHCNIPPCIMQLLTVSSVQDVIFSMHRISYITKSLMRSLDCGAMIPTIFSNGFAMWRRSERKIQLIIARPGHNLCCWSKTLRATTDHSVMVLIHSNWARSSTLNSQTWLKVIIRIMVNLYSFNLSPIKTLFSWFLYVYESSTKYDNEEEFWWSNQ